MTYIVRSCFFSHLETGPYLFICYWPASKYLICSALGKSRITLLTTMRHDCCIVCLTSLQMNINAQHVFVFSILTLSVFIPVEDEVLRMQTDTSICEGLLEFEVLMTHTLCYQSKPVAKYFFNYLFVHYLCPMFNFVLRTTCCTFELTKTAFASLLLHVLSKASRTSFNSNTGTDTLMPEYL